MPVTHLQPVRRLGTGGQADVWLAQPAGDGAAVAVKRVFGPSPGAAWAVLGAEVRAMAAVSHPNVLRIFDWGRLGSDWGPFLQGEVVLVAEYASEGSLAPWCGATDWQAAKPILLSILDALAVAHARSIVHRDLKPENVLLCGPNDARPGPKLADFGLARRFDAGWTPVAGTPAYMAPEQVAGEWRNLGPWTDLFAFGRLIAALLTGDPLAAPTALARIHPGLADLVAHLLSEEPGARPPFAADVAAVLRGLIADERSTREPSRAPLSALTYEVLPSRPAAATPADPVPPGALGIGLFRLRQPTYVGRVAERETLRRALADVAETQVPRVFLLHGPTGIGKSRLAEIASEDAHAAGLAHTLRFQGDRFPEGVTRRLPSGQEPIGALAATLAAMASDRPLLVWIDDANDAPTAIEGVARLLMQRAPVLVLLTQDDEGSAALSITAERMPIGPHPDLEGLLEASLPLTPGFRSWLATRSAGNPLLALSVLSDALDRELLIASPHGWELPPDASWTFPDELTAAWRDRFEAFFERWAPEAAEIAAVLGDPVDPLEWADACAEADIALPETLGDALVAARLAERPVETPGALRFAHPLARTVLTDRAADHGRLARWHRACAVVLPESARESRGRHRIGAGDAAAGVRDLLAEARERLKAGLLVAADGLLGEIARARPLPEGLEAERGYLAGRIALERGRTAEAFAALENVASLTRASRPDLLPQLLSDTATAAGAVGHLAGLDARYQLASDAARDAGDPGLALLVAVERARALTMQGKPAESLHRMEELKAEVEASPDQRAAKSRLRHLAQAYAQLGDRGRAREAMTSFLAASTSEAQRASGENFIAAMWHLDGDLERAEEGYTRALTCARRAGSASQRSIELNLAAVWLDRGRFAEARQVVATNIAQAERAGHTSVVTAGLAMLVPCLAFDRAGTILDRDLARLDTLLERTGAWEPMVTLRLTQAAALCDDWDAGRAGAIREVLARAQPQTPTA